MRSVRPSMSAVLTACPPVVGTGSIYCDYGDCSVFGGSSLWIRSHCKATLKSFLAVFVFFMGFQGIFDSVFRLLGFFFLFYDIGLDPAKLQTSQKAVGIIVVRGYQLYYHVNTFYYNPAHINTDMITMLDYRNYQANQTKRLTSEIDTLLSQHSKMFCYFDYPIYVELPEQNMKVIQNTIINA